MTLLTRIPDLLSGVTKRGDREHMAQIPVRLTTQGMTFPMLSEQCGLTVVDGRGDLTYVPGVSTDGDVPENRGVPGILYAENVMPSTNGWQSVSYTAMVQFASEQYTFYDIQLVHGASIASGSSRPSASGLRTYVAMAYVEATGQTSVFYLTPGGAWANLTLQGAGPMIVTGQPLITTAHVNGYTYLCIENVAYGIINVDTGVLIPRTFAGLDMQAVKGLVSANGHLIAFTINSLAWSSTVDVEDFVPSDVSGAGGGGVQEAAGDIIVCKASPIGFIIFTDSNCVAAIYTGNSAYPFEYKEIPSAGGVARSSHISDDTISGSYYAITSAGIQKISSTGAQTVLTNIADFLSGKVIETWDNSVGQLVRTTLPGDMGRKIQTIANRYIIISYAHSDTYVHQYAIVVDAIQNRLGRLKVENTRFFELGRTEAFPNLDPRATLGVMNKRGGISRIRFDLDCAQAAGVMLFGRIQYMHQRLTQMQEVKLERTCPAGNFSLGIMVSYDGTNFSPVSVGYVRPEDTAKFSRRYLFSAVGVNHTLVVRGAFDINSILVSLNLHGMTSSMT